MLPFNELGFIGNLASPGDMLVIALLALLLFGRRLPEVGKNLGKTIVEFKKGLSGVASGDGVAEEEQEEEVRPAKKPVQRLSASTGTSGSRSKALPTTEEV